MQSNAQQNWDTEGFTLARFSGIQLNKRDRLISMLMQDRGVLRLVSAPHGYGKSMLCYEYARRMFASGNIAWIDGPSPEFYHALDNGSLIPEGVAPDGKLDLVVIDNLPWLDEDRRSVLIKHVDKLLYKGTEVMVNVLPSNDFIRSCQPDRILITAEDLLVTERDAQKQTTGEEELTSAFVKERWRTAQRKLFGKAPCSVWSENSASASVYLTGYFEEKLPLEFKKAAFAMILLGKGTYRDLERIEAKPHFDSDSLFAKDYPFLGLDPVQQEFELGEFPFDELKRVLVDSGLSNVLLKGSMPLCEKCLSVLLNRGETERAGNILDVFCSDMRCEAWLKDCGWNLLDSNEGTLLQTLFNRCRDETLANDMQLQALRSWSCGLKGDVREASYYAQRILKKESLVAEDSNLDQFPAFVAYLSMLAFSQKDAGALSKERCATGEICRSRDFLAAVVDLCTEEELKRALSVLEGNIAPLGAKQRKSRPKEAPERDETLVFLFTGTGERFRNTLAYRIALHFAFNINSAPIRKLASDLGCGLLINMRRNGLSSFSQAIVIADLWRNGFFGLDGKKMDIYDARLLDSAATFLTRLAQMAGKETPAIPWQAGGKAMAQTASEASGKKSRSAISLNENVPIANVKLFGGLEICIGNRFIPETHWGHRPLQLFAILVMFQGRDVSRQTIFEQIWPDLSRPRALDNFYTAWSRAQSLIGEGPYMIRRGDYCSVSARYVNSDVAEFDQLTRRLLTERDDANVILDIYARLEVIYAGGLLPSEQGNPFIDTQRERYKATFVDGMVAASARSLEMHDARLAMWFARKAMDEDDKREDVYNALIKAQMASGQRCSAMRTFTQCRTFMREELGLDPSTETQDLYASLLSTDPSLIKLDPLMNRGI